VMRPGAGGDAPSSEDWLAPVVPPTLQRRQSRVADPNGITRTLRIRFLGSEVVG
jgi:hypothetical protein